MTAVVMVLLGAGVGLGVLLTWRALAPRPPSIDAILAGLARPGTAIDTSAPAAHDQFDRIGSTARRVVEALGYDAERHHQELDLVGPNLAATALVVMGIPAPVGLIAILSVVTAVAGFLMPDMLLRDEADKRRRAFRHTLSSYLDLVNVLLAGGAGIETALHAAADAGDGWGYQTIRAELRRARLTGQSPWDTFAQLARIRASLAAKADTLRGHQVAETEAAAEAATERMTVPVAVLLFGFLVFIAYPAVVQITSVSGPQP